MLRALRSAVGPDEWKRVAGPGREALDRLVDAERHLAATAEFHLFDGLHLLSALAATSPVAPRGRLAVGRRRPVQLLEFVQRHAATSRFRCRYLPCR
jgi:hypothetical protein